MLSRRAGPQTGAGTRSCATLPHLRVCQVGLGAHRRTLTPVLEHLVQLLQLLGSRGLPLVICVVSVPPLLPSPTIPAPPSAVGRRRLGLWPASEDWSSK